MSHAYESIDTYKLYSSLQGTSQLHFKVLYLLRGPPCNPSMQIKQLKYIFQIFCYKPSETFIHRVLGDKLKHNNISPLSCHPQVL